MNTQLIKAKITQHNDKRGLKVVLYLTAEQKEIFLLDNGSQPEGMIQIEVKEVA